MVGGHGVMRLTLAPGWLWGTDVRPGVGTNQFQASHRGVIVSGAAEAVHQGGTGKVYRVGDACSITPRHDVRVLGDEVANVGSRAIFEGIRLCSFVIEINDNYQ